MSWTRRLFLRETYLGWLALVIGPAAYGVIRGALRHAGSSALAPEELGAASDFAPGTSRLVYFGGEKVIVVKTIAGTLYAVSAVCTHLGCSIRLETREGTEKLACNCHKSEFTLDGENLSGPATIPLQRFDIREEGGKVWLSDHVEDAQGQQA